MVVTTEGKVKMRFLVKKFGLEEYFFVVVSFEIKSNVFFRRNVMLFLLNFNRIIYHTLFFIKYKLFCTKFLKLIALGSHP